MVEGRSIRVSLECRRGIPTVEAGEGGTSSTSSATSGVVARSSVCADRLEEFEVDLPKKRVREADRRSEEAKSIID